MYLRQPPKFLVRTETCALNSPTFQFMHELHGEYSVLLSTVDIHLSSLFIFFCLVALQTELNLKVFWSQKSSYGGRSTEEQGKVPSGDDVANNETDSRVKKHNGTIISSTERYPTGPFCSQGVDDWIFLRISFFPSKEGGHGLLYGSSRGSWKFSYFINVKICVRRGRSFTLSIVPSVFNMKRRH